MSAAHADCGAARQGCFSGEGSASVPYAAEQVSHYVPSHGCAEQHAYGVGGKVPFDEDIGAAGTGANGIDITLNGTAYKAYGEFSLIDAETTIYIEGE